MSPNTLREAFRLLTHEGLLVHELNRGIFVRVVTVEGLIDIYRVRRMIECAAVRSLGEPPYALEAVEAAVEAGEQAARGEAWQELSTANIRFHQAVAALAGSPRTDELMRGVLAELRLVFHVMADPRRFHEPYLTRNRQILKALRAGDPAEAEQLLAGASCRRPAQCNAADHCPVPAFWGHYPPATRWAYASASCACESSVLPKTPTIPGPNGADL